MPHTCHTHATHMPHTRVNKGGATHTREQRKRMGPEDTRVNVNKGHACEQRGLRLLPLNPPTLNLPPLNLPTCQLTCSLLPNGFPMKSSWWNTPFLFENTADLAAYTNERDSYVSKITTRAPGVMRSWRGM